MENNKAQFFNWVGCSRWTNASRNMAVHICKDNSGSPLCERQYAGGALRIEELNLNEVTCKKCLSKYEKKRQEIRASAF